MSETKLTLSIRNDSGHSLTFREDTPELLGDLISASEGTEWFDAFFVTGTKTRARAPELMPEPPVNAVQQMVDETAARQKAVDEEIASKKAEEALGPGEELAPEALLKAAAKKKGVDLEQLGPISTNKAKHIIKGERDIDVPPPPPPTLYQESGLSGKAVGVQGCLRCERYGAEHVGDHLGGGSWPRS